MSGSSTRSASRSLFANGALALGATACCTIPLLVGVLGLSVAGGWMRTMDVLHPWMMGGMVVVLLWWGVQTFRASRGASCADAKCETPHRRSGAWALAAHGVLMALVLASPKLASCQFGESAPAAAQAAPETTQAVVFEVEGMTCGGCAQGIQTTLRRAAGVIEVDVTHEPPHARIRYDLTETDEDSLRGLIDSIGYTVVGTVAPEASAPSE